MKVVIAGGGTGGHLYPGIALADRLKERGIDAIFLVSDRGIERKVLTPLGYKFIEQEETPLKGESFIKRFRSLGKILKNIKLAMRYIEKDDKIVLLGGFASFSAGISGLIKSVEIYIHEQNSVMGLSNRFFSKYAKKVFLSFENTLKAPESGIVVGNPVRKVFENRCAKQKPDKHIFVVGGSQGSRFLNNLIVHSSKNLLDRGFKIVHQTGDKLFDETLDAYKKIGVDTESIEVKRYIDDISATYEWADIVLSRAGSGSIFEIMYSRRFGVFVPFAAATDNHQFFNALYAQTKGVGVVLEEKEATVEKFLNAIDEYYKHFDMYKKNMDNVVYLDTAGLILKEMEI